MADKWRTDARLGALCELVHRTILEAAQLHIPRGWRKLAKCGVVGRCQPDELQDRQSSRAAHPTAQGLKSLEPSQQSGQSRYPREQAGQVAGVCLNAHHLHVPCHNPPRLQGHQQHHRPTLHRGWISGAEDRQTERYLQAPHPGQGEGRRIRQRVRARQSPKTPREHDRAVKSEIATFAGECVCCAGAKSGLCQRFTKPELKCTIWSLKSRKVSGPDGVSNDMPKRLGLRTLHCLLHLLNHSWSSGLVPEPFKKSTIVPIAKRGKPPGMIGSF